MKKNFRVWDVESKKMYLVAFPTWNGMIETRDGDHTHPTFFLSQNGPEQEGILMQFTGLLDKNGKEIYEGDILAGHNPRYEEAGGEPSVIKWDEENACFAIFRGGVSSGYKISSEVEWNEIIGNIWENPDLLSNPKLK